MEKIELCVAGTGSAGNTYVINWNDKSLIIDAGIKPKNVLPYITGKIIGLLLSHTHNDHAKYINDWTGRGVQIVYGTPYQLSDDCKVKPFELSHDVTNYGYYIKIGDHRLAYITDTGRIDTLFNGLDTLIIEANYDDKLLEDSYLRDKINGALYNRIHDYHLSIDKAQEFIIKQEKISPLSNVILIHLSDRHSNAREFHHQAARVTGAYVSIAKNGLRIKL
jgi:ribonuclease BN (tRNA processing enzyme)